MARNAEEQADAQPVSDSDDLSHLFRDESGGEVLLSVTDETLALFESAFGAEPVGLDSFLSLNFFAFG